LVEVFIIKKYQYRIFQAFLVFLPLLLFLSSSLVSIFGSAYVVSFDAPTFVGEILA
jgi:hypothetical protein